MTQPMRIELAEIARSIPSQVSSLPTLTSDDSDDYDDAHKYESEWAAVQRLPTFERMTTALFDDKVDGKADTAGNIRGKRLINVTKLGPDERRLFIEKLIKHVQNDNLRLLKKIRRRIERAGVQLPTVEVRYKNLCVQAECQLVYGKPLPTLWNATKGVFSASISAH